MPHGYLVPVLEIGGTHVTAAVVDLDGGYGPVVHHVRRADLVASEAAEDVVQRIVDCAEAIGAPLGRPWGVAVPGPFDYDHGVALFKDVDKFDALHGLDLGKILLRRLPSAPLKVRFVNDAEAFLRGESLAGAARGHNRAVGLTLGTGIGSAFLADQVMVRGGPTVPPSGHIYLIRVGGVPLEDVVSSRAITKRYAALSGDTCDAREVAARAKAGDAAAALVFEFAFLALGKAVGPWLTRFAASVVVVGGSIARSWELVAPPLERGLHLAARSPSRTQVAPAANPHQAPLIGAAWAAVHPSTPDLLEQ